jgi:chromosome partitioning protein
MSKTKTVYIGGSKGGTTKSVTSHLLALGAILRNQSAAYVLTDPNRKIRGEGRPYSVFDGKMANDLANILNASRSTLNGWLILDGGGNRPAFDAAIAETVDLCIIPFRASQEDVDTVADDMERLTDALAWPAAWPTNSLAAKSAQRYIDDLTKKFPSRMIATPIPFVNSVSDLLATSLDSPSSPVRQLARKVFSVMAEEYDSLLSYGSLQTIAG